MKLLLTSQGIHNQTIAEALKSLLPKPPGECKAVYIPTSLNATLGDKTWFVRNLCDAHNMAWLSFQIIDIAAMDPFPRSYWWPSIEQADVLFVGGGANYYLGYWMEKSGLAASLPNLLENTVYVGSSAGSMYLTQSLDFSSQALRAFQCNEPIPAQGLGPEGQSSGQALKYVPLELRPHYGNEKQELTTDDTLYGVLKHKQHPLYALDDNSAIVVHDDVMRVVSEGNWRLFQK